MIRSTMPNNFRRIPSRFTTSGQVLCSLSFQIYRGRRMDNGGKMAWLSCGNSRAVPLGHSLYDQTAEHPDYGE